MGLWRMTEKSFARLAHGKWSPLRLPPHIRSPKDRKIASIFEDGLGRLWYSLRRGAGESYCVRNGVLETLIVVAAHDRYTGRGAVRDDHPGGGEAVHPFHPDIHQNDVRMRARIYGYRFGAILALVHLGGNAR